MISKVANETSLEGISRLEFLVLYYFDLSNWKVFEKSDTGRLMVIMRGKK